MLANLSFSPKEDDLSISYFLELILVITTKYDSCQKNLMLNIKGVRIFSNLLLNVITYVITLSDKLEKF